MQKTNEYPGIVVVSPISFLPITLGSFLFSVTCFMCCVHIGNNQGGFGGRLRYKSAIHPPNDLPRT